jgi:hypothetical protein
MRAWVLATALLIQQAGCNQAPLTPRTTAPKPEPAHYQRFVPIPANTPNMVGVPWSAALALDTMTGQLCRTYAMPMGKWDDLALCWDLYYHRPKAADEF